MPYSKSQQSAARIALACKEGKIPMAKLKGASLEMFKSMSTEELRDFAHSKIKKVN